MWRAESTLLLVVGAQQIECVEIPRAGRREWLADRFATVLIDFATSPEAPALAMLSALEQLVHSLTSVRTSGPDAPLVRGVRVLVSDCWLASTTVPWNSALEHTALAQSYVRTHLVASGFDLAQADTLRIDDAAHGEPRTVAAYSAALLDTLGGLAARLGAKLESVLPLNVAACWAARGQTGTRIAALAVLEGSSVSLLRMPGRSMLPAGQSLVLDPSTDPATSLEALWRRQQLREPGLANLAQLHVVDLRSAGRPLLLGAANALRLVPLPGSTSSVVATLVLRLARLAGGTVHPTDAVLRAPPMTKSRVLVAAVAMSVACVGVVQAVRLSARAHSEEQALTARTKQSPKPARIPLSRAEQSRVQGVNAAIRELNTPVAALLRAMQPPRDIRVALLGIELAPSGAVDGGADASTIKLSAEAPSGADMARFVAFLSERRPFVGAYLTRHEINEADASRPYRFTVEATWHE